MREGEGVMTVDHDLSPEAVLCLARWFAGPKDDLRSHEPHATLARHRVEMDELVAKGFLTVEPFNRAGSLWYRSTPKAAGIGWAERQRQIRALFDTDTPAGRAALARSETASGRGDGDRGGVDV